LVCIDINNDFTSFGCKLCSEHAWSGVSAVEEMEGMMAFKRKYQQKGTSTLESVGGYLKSGWHTVTIRNVRDMETTLVLDYVGDFGDMHTDRLFISATDGKNYSGKLADLLIAVPEDVMKETVETDNFSTLEGSKVRIRLGRTEGNYIKRVNEGFVIEGEERSKPFPSIGEARAALDVMGNKAYLRVQEVDSVEKVEGIVW